MSAREKQIWSTHTGEVIASFSALEEANKYGGEATPSSTRE